ncbi:sensor histidine kinase [Dactylosporangium sp. AC04546]|uniref:sensor histidine kinase n=1 Tax=Dactylosporangium sp. AC04546 TaxID=2862460 RepID=UPI001EDF3C8E|nr:sensor histidine kinase [Dactylosporangium sp. AC04546]WVK84291.1 sensor histidine kinase [Dactylosporangium sp. AC04546]
MDRRTLLVDGGIAGITLAIALGTLGAGGLGTPSPLATPLDLVGVILAIVASAPLAARERAPMTVYATITAGTLTLLVLNYPLDFPLGAAIAGYTVAVRYSGVPDPVRRRGALAAVVGFGPALVVIYSVAGDNLFDITVELTALGVMFGAVWIAGDRSRLRRERIVALEERAARTEREVEREHRLAAAQERTRIARELHDSAGHAISVILVQAGAARLLHERDPERSRRALHTIEDVARGTMDEISRLVRALREDGQSDLTPADPAAIDDLLAGFRAGGLSLTSHVEGSFAAVPRSVASAAYRILQEALTNATRHGEGSADVAVRFTADAVEITVTNPARSSAPVTGGGHGIVGMRERAVLLGGTLRTERADGRYRLSARLPQLAAGSVAA